MVNYTSRGGFLADEMGMGKTLVCISLIVSNPCVDAFDGGTDGKGSDIWLKRRLKELRSRKVHGWRISSQPNPAYDQVALP